MCIKIDKICFPSNVPSWDENKVPLTNLSLKTRENLVSQSHI